MNDIYDVLEICLQELENGADMESVLARYPELAAELRPILKASVHGADAKHVSACTFAGSRSSRTRKGVATGRADAGSKSRSRANV